MSGDVCKTKELRVSVQENGIIRNKVGLIIARLADDVSFKACGVAETENWEAWKEEVEDLKREISVLEDEARDYERKIAELEQEAEDLEDRIERIKDI
ncbi:hypothetical protein IID24_03350 [Patescibacteria group bacterium]|nr:hypothetical protein [Patescibacteria group bacterium]